MLSETVNLMRGRLRGITWRSYSKTFLKRNCSSGKTTEEKSAEVSKEAWPSIRKYSPIWIPAMLAVVVTVDVCNNTYHRTVIGSYAPRYIEFVREHIGFEDEDWEEISRVKRTISEQCGSFRAVIELLSGAEAIEESVDGKISYGDFYQQMQSKYSSQGGIGRITFLDNELSDSVENTDEFQSLPAIKTVPSSSEKNYVIALMIDSPLRRTLWETSAGSETTASSSSSSRPTAENEAKGSNQGGWAAAIFGTQRPDFSGPSLSRTTMALRFESVVSTVISDWRHFKAIQNPNILLIKGEGSVDLQDSKNGGELPNASMAKSTDRNRMARLVAVDEARLTVASLEARISNLKAEKRLGTREIDQIDSEIALMNSEISSLKRQYLNRFYFF